MNGDWQARETTTHQDHVIAHVIGASALGYFVFDEALYILLDIGFVWMIFVDCEMGLLPHPVAVNELEIAEPLRNQIKADIDLLLSDKVSPDGLSQLIQTPVGCQIKEVSFFGQGNRRRLIITGEAASLAIETSLTTAEIQVYGL
ncbi:MAG: hypothetical protein H7Z16_07870 [Pyrinomonadaceae bacterium]|nr:hypothetical protein [Pyrinomonadaceae bacterium]